MGRNKSSEPRACDVNAKALGKPKNKRRKYSQRGRMTEDQQQLALDYLPLARSLAKPLRKIGRRRATSSSRPHASRWSRPRNRTTGRGG